MKIKYNRKIKNIFFILEKDVYFKNNNKKYINITKFNFEFILKKKRLNFNVYIILIIFEFYACHYLK